jgi:hypothetical protein
VRYRSKTLEVEAMQLTSRDPDALVAWCGGPGHAWFQIYGEMMNVYVETISGPVHLDAGDWVVKHPDGALEAVSNRSFREIYEKSEAVDG